MVLTQFPSDNLGPLQPKPPQWPKGAARSRGSQLRRLQLVTDKVAFFDCSLSSGPKVPASPRKPGPRERLLLRRAAHMQSTFGSASVSASASEKACGHVVDCGTPRLVSTSAVTKEATNHTVAFCSDLLAFKPRVLDEHSYLKDSLFILIFEWVDILCIITARKVSHQVYVCIKALLHRYPHLHACVDEYLASTVYRNDPRVWVGIRVRPCDERNDFLEIERNRVTLTKMQKQHQAIEEASASFFFDAAFDDTANQMDVWTRLQPPLMRSLMRQEHACVLVYGQTGSGKTHTMFGNPNNTEDAGVAYRVAKSLSRMLMQLNQASRPLVEFSFLEVYNERIRDLLIDPANIQSDGARVLQPSSAHSSGDSRATSQGFVPGLVRRVCDLSCLEEQLSDWLLEGANVRAAGHTVFNASSSRSHAVATLHLQWCKQPNESEEVRLYLVDLAGSERAGKYALSKEQLVEGVNINKSLTALARVVRVLAEGQGERPPYRDSMLTRLLSDAITGRSARAFMIAAVHPRHQAETLSTLRYAENYSALRSNTSNQLAKLTSEVRLLRNRLSCVSTEFREACEEIARQSRGGPWSTQMLDERMVRIKYTAKTLFKDHASLRWTKTHWNKRSLGAIGFVTSVVDRPPQRQKGEAPDGRRLKPRVVADDDGLDRAVEVCYAGKHGKPSTTLWYPEEALRDIAPPAILRDLLAQESKLTAALVQKQEELQRTKDVFAEEQQRWMERA